MRMLYSNDTTSREAAESLSHNTTTAIREQVFAYIERQGAEGATDEEIENALEISGNTTRPRRSELWSAGRIKKAEFQRKTSSGRNAQVWVVKR